MSIAVQVQGPAVVFSPNERECLPQRFVFDDPAKATRFARVVHRVLNEGIDVGPETTLVELALLWMSRGGGAVSDTTFTQYTRDLRKWILPFEGATPLCECTADAYLHLFRELAAYRRCDDPEVAARAQRAAKRTRERPSRAIHPRAGGASDMAGVSESVYRRVVRTLGAVMTWARREKLWPMGWLPFGDPLSQRAAHKQFFSLGRAYDAQTSRTQGLIDISLCPTITQTRKFGEALTAAAVNRWDDSAAYIGQAPLVQFITGCRVSELLVCHADQFSLDGPAATLTVAAQLGDGGWRVSGRGRHGVVGAPTLKPPKNKSPRQVELWPWAVGPISEACDEARAERDGWLFAPPRPIKAWARGFIDVYAAAAIESGYPFTSHWHRHAFASYNLAVRSQGGYGRNPRQVADWLGHANVALTTRTYWHPTPNEPGWGDHEPGDTG